MAKRKAALVSEATPGRRHGTEFDLLVGHDGHRTPVLQGPAGILAQIHDGVVSTDMDGTVLTWNQAAERIFGYTAAEAIGRHVGFLAFPKDLPQIEERVLAPTRVHGMHELEARCRCKDGQEIFVAARLSLQRDANGEPVALLGCSNDITERRRTAKALRRQRQEQEIILDAMPAMVWYKDRDNRILRANRAAAESMQTSAAELTGRSTYEVYPEEAAKYHRDDLEVITSGRPKLGIVEPLQTGSGEKRWVRTDKVPYRNERGEIIGVIVFAVDITDLKRAEAALACSRDELEQRVRERTAELAGAVESLRTQITERERVEEEMRRQQAELAHILRLHTVEGVAAELAHEINQPLGAIANFANGLAERLRRKGVDRTSMLDAVEQISKQALRAAEILRRLREFTRKDPPQRVECDVNRLVRDAVGLLAADLRSHRITSHLSLDERLPHAIADPVQVEQVILNLLRNGVEAIADSGNIAGSELWVETRRRGSGNIEVTVRDTGGGIGAGTRKRLFEAFFTTKQGGLGMGLSISHSIVDAHGGRLWAPRHMGRGATFRFTLPSCLTPGAQPRQKSLKGRSGFPR